MTDNPKEYMDDPLYGAPPEAMTTPEPNIVVEEVDRDAVRRLVGRDDNSLLLAFARHRIEAVEAQKERDAQIAENIPARVSFHYEGPNGRSGARTRPITRADIATAIRSTGKAGA